MKEKNKPIFCGLAFGSASINNYGQYIPCCNIDVTKFPNKPESGEVDLAPEIRINSGSLQKIRKELKNGTWPEACIKCKNVENDGGISMREMWNRSLANYKIPIKIKINPHDVRYLDLSLGNKCNSKCMTCNVDSSDQWREEYNYIWEDRLDTDRFIPVQNDRPAQDIEKIKLICNTFQNLHHISFIGGEPTIIESNKFLLENLISRGVSKNIDINYVTNLTGADEDLLDIWKNFRSVSLAVSIDGYKELNEYIRYPIKWSKVETNLRRFFELSFEYNFDCNLSCTVSALNIHGVVDLMRFWFNLVKEFGERNNFYKNTGVWMNRVSFPPYLKFELLPLAYRKGLIPQCEEFIVELKNHKDRHAVKSLLNNMNLLINWLNEEHTVSKKDWKDMVYFIKKSDEYRKRSLVDYAPNLYEEIFIKPDLGRP